MSDDVDWDWSAVGSCFDVLVEPHEQFSALGPRAPVDDWVSTALRQALRGVPPGRVLDMGCGTGRAAALALAAGHHVRLIDASEAMLERAASRLAQVPLDRFELHRVDVLADLRKATTRYDLVLGVGEVLAYLPTPNRVVTLLCKRLRTGGRFLGTYMRRQELLRRLSASQVVRDDGDVLVLVERDNLPDGRTLWAQAFSDDYAAGLVAAAGLQLDELAASEGAARGGLLASRPCSPLSC